MTQDLVLFEQRGSVAVVTLNRPERLNAITPALVDQLCESIQFAQADPGVRALVFTGAGSSFCAGDDLRDTTAHNAPAAQQQRFVEQLQQVTRLLMFGRLPVVAAVRGWAVGGGLEWLFNADFVIAGSSTRGFFPEMGLGLFPTGGITVLLPRIVGDARARSLLITGERISADQLLAWGVATEVVADQDVLNRTLAFAESIVSLPQARVEALLSALRAPYADELEQALQREAQATIEALCDPGTAARLAAAAPGKSD